jgi:hypothetical protein
MKVMLLALRVEVAGRFADDLYHCMALMKAGCYWGVQVWKWNPLTHSIYVSGTTDRYVSQDTQVQPYPCGAKHLLKFRERDRGEEKKTVCLQSSSPSPKQARGVSNCVPLDYLILTPPSLKLSQPGQACLMTLTAAR